MANEVIALGGQSNIVGMNTGTSPVYTNATRIHNYSQPWSTVYNQPINVTDPSVGSWGIASDPIHSEPSSAVGLGMAMADKYLTNKNDSSLNVGLVPCGWNGSRINSEWARMAHHGNGFTHLVARARAAQAWGTLKCLVWYQGESDTSSDISYPTWQNAFCELITFFRFYVGLPDLPVILISLGPCPGTTGYDPTAWANLQAQQSYIDNSLKPLRVIPAAGYSVCTDGLHLTIASQVTLGHTCADTLVSMQ